MAAKTVTLELDAYEKLWRAKRPGESFTEVVRRATFENAFVTGADLLKYYRKGGSGVSEEYLSSIEKAVEQDRLPKAPCA